MVTPQDIIDLTGTTVATGTIQTYITLAGELISQYTDRTFTEVATGTAITGETLSVALSQGSTREYPIGTPTAVDIDGDSVTIELYDSKTGILDFESLWVGSATGSYILLPDPGYPLALKLVVINMINAGGVTPERFRSETLGDYSYTREALTGSTGPLAGCEGILDSLRRRTL